jgi:hypothetical protein
MAWKKSLARKVEHHGRVLANRIEQHGPFELARCFTQDMNGLGFQRTQVRQAAA